MAQTLSDDAVGAFALEEQALATIVACQRAAGYREVCGFLALDREGKQRFLALVNTGSDPNRFETMTADEAAVRSIVNQLGWRIIAFIHTHLGYGLDMSTHDANEFHGDELPWIIVDINGTHARQRTYRSD